MRLFCVTVRLIPTWFALPVRPRTAMGSRPQTERLAPLPLRGQVVIRASRAIALHGQDAHRKQGLWQVLHLVPCPRC